MKKALLASTYGDFFWSFERDNITTLKNLGYRVYIIANFLDEKYNKHTKEIESLGVKIIHIPFERSPFSRKTITNYFRVKKIIEELQPQIVDCHLAVVGVLVRLACWSKRQIKVLYSPHGFFFYKGCPVLNSIIYRGVEKIMARRTDALIVINSEDYLNAQKMSVRGEVYYVPGVGIDLEKTMEPAGNIRQELQLEQGDMLLVSVGELNRNKNHIVVIEALKILSERGINHIHYAICGEGDERDKLSYVIKKYNLEAKVHLLGYRNDVVGINKSADIFVLPSYKEGLSVSIIEAMGCGVPIIASKIRGNVDLVENQKGGLLFEPNDEVELSRQIEFLIKNEEIRNEMSHFNREQSKKYSVGNVHKIMNQIYQDVEGNE